MFRFHDDGVFLFFFSQRVFLLLETILSRTSLLCEAKPAAKREANRARLQLYRLSSRNKPRL